MHLAFGSRSQYRPCLLQVLCGALEVMEYISERAFIGLAAQHLRVPPYHEVERVGPFVDDILQECAIAIHVLELHSASIDRYG